MQINKGKYVDWHIFSHNRGGDESSTDPSHNHSCHMSSDKNSAADAGIGAEGGAILTGGSAVATVGGAAVGGVIGNQVGKD